MSGGGSGYVGLKFAKQCSTHRKYYRSQIYIFFSFFSGSCSSSAIHYNPAPKARVSFISRVITALCRASVTEVCFSKVSIQWKKSYETAFLQKRKGFLGEVLTAGSAILETATFRRVDRFLNDRNLFFPQNHQCSLRNALLAGVAQSTISTVVISCHADAGSLEKKLSVQKNILKHTFSFSRSPFK